MLQSGIVMRYVLPVRRWYRGGDRLVRTYSKFFPTVALLSLRLACGNPLMRNHGSALAPRQPWEAVYLEAHPASSTIGRSFLTSQAGLCKATFPVVPCLQAGQRCQGTWAKRKSPLVRSNRGTHRAWTPRQPASRV